MTAFVALVKIIGEKLTKLQLFSWIAALVLGGATILYKDENIIKWKPTVLYAAISLAFFVTQFLNKKSLVETLIGDKVPAPIAMLRRVNLATGFFFLFLGLLNIVVAQNVSTTVCVYFKLIGISLLNIGFLGACLYYLRDYLGNMFPPDQPKK